MRRSVVGTLSLAAVLVVSGFGGRVYFPTGKGFIVLQAMPAPSPRK